MTSPAIRRGRRVSLAARYPDRDPAMPQFISNHGLRMVEASLRAAALPPHGAPAASAAPRLDGLELAVWDGNGGTPASLAEAIIAFDPDIAGFSAYLWSFPFFVEVARLLKDDDPSRLIVFGGPSARASMLRLEPFRGAHEWIDVLVINDGEQTMVDLVAADDRRPAALLGVPGIAVRSTEDGWTETPPRPLADLNELPSPYEMGLVPGGGLAVLQTYRGCPFTCSFCEWGTLESPRNVRGVDQLRREFDGMAGGDPGGALLVDAGLNLNPHAFNNLRDAADRHGFFDSRMLICEVYPAKVRDEHIAFLRGIAQPLVGIGLQSFDNSVLKHVERSYDEQRFEQTFSELSSVAGVAVEIILGLPGDTPDNFRRSFERARAMPCALRVYHCVVLPSALMVRAPANYAMDYDPVSLKMRSCLGWPAEALERECAHVSARAAAEGGRSGEFFWVFPPPRRG